jgi:hypothetical protein
MLAGAQLGIIEQHYLRGTARHPALARNPRRTIHRGQLKSAVSGKGHDSPALS